MHKSRIRTAAVAFAAAAFTSALALPAGASAATMVFGSTDDAVNHVVFSTSERMVPADLDNSTDVYDRSGGVTRLVSIGPAGGNGAFNTTFNGISGTGGRIVFSTDERLTTDDTDSVRDVYFLQGGVLSRASGDGAANGNGNFDATFASIDRGSGRIAFHTNEKLAGSDTDSVQDVYIRAAGVVHVSVPPATSPQNGNSAIASTFAGFGSSGDKVLFHTNESLSVADGDAVQDIYEWDDPGANQFVSDSDDDAAVPAFFKAADGEDIYFESNEEVVDADDNDGTDTDVWMRDLDAGTELASNDFTTEPVAFQGISDLSGRIYVETTEANAGDTDTETDVYEITNQVARLVSVEDGNGSDDAAATFAGVDEDGDHVAFSTTENMFNEGDGDASADVYQYNRAADEVDLGGVDSTGATSTFRGFSNDGTRLLFSTIAKAAPTDLDTQADVFVNLNQDNDATQLTPGNANVGIVFGRASFNGRDIAYTTQESLLPTDGDGESDVYKTLNGTATSLESFETVPPDTTITSGPTGLTKFSPPPFGFSSNEPGVTFSCRFDGAPFGACGSQAKLAQGPHTYEVRATDHAGNVDPTPASRAFVVDSIGPRLTISKKARRASRKRAFSVTVICPKSEHGGCKGKLTLKTSKKVKVGKKRKVVTFATKSFALKPGQKANLKLKISKSNLKLLRKLKKVRLAVSGAAADGLGNKFTVTVGVTLRPPK